MNNFVTNNGNEEDTNCRICLDVEPARDLVSPCNCMGSTKFVHQGCLLEYAKKNNKIIYNEASVRFELKCEICNFVMGVHGEKVCQLNSCETVLQIFSQNLSSLLLSIVVLLLSFGALGFLVNMISSKDFSSFSSYEYGLFGLILLSGAICLALLYLVLKQLLVS